MATAVSKGVKEFVFEWEGKDRGGKQVRGEIRASGENQVKSSLRRQGVLPSKIKKRAMRSGKSIKPRDIAIFTLALGLPRPTISKDWSNGTPAFIMVASWRVRWRCRAA